MELRAAYAFVLALFLAMALIPILVRVAAPLGLVDAPDPRKVHKGRIPRIGGVAIVIGCLDCSSAPLRKLSNSRRKSVPETVREPALITSSV